MNGIEKRCWQKESLTKKPDSANWVVFQPNVIIDAKLGKNRPLEIFFPPKMAVPLNMCTSQS